MTVRELIELLQQQNPEATVVVEDPTVGNTGDLNEAAEVTSGFFDPKLPSRGFGLLPTERRKTPAVLID